MQQLLRTTASDTNGQGLPFLHSIKGSFALRPGYDGPLQNRLTDCRASGELDIVPGTAFAVRCNEVSGEARIDADGSFEYLPRWDHKVRVVRVRLDGGGLAKG